MGRRPTSSGETIGQRLSRLRRERGITQIELAERIGVAQPHVSGYERGSLRLHAELIIEIAKSLDVSTDELLGVDTARSASDSQNWRLRRRLRDIERLPKRDQQALFRTIDAFIAKSP